MSAPFQRVMVLDFETYWHSKEYTLSKMTTEEYVRDPRFQAQGLAYKWLGENTPIWLSGSHMERFLKNVDWGTTAVVCHNAQFDCFILSHRYGVHPAFIFDTLSMSRALRGPDGGNSLRALAEAFGLRNKGHATASTDGLLKLPLAVEQELADYCKHDVALCEAVFQMLRKGYASSTERVVEKFPVAELELIDATIKMYTNPVIELDLEMLQENLSDDTQRKQALLARLGVAESDLASNDRFAALLSQLGVEPPTKISKTTGKEAWALAKNDALFQQLIDHPDENIALLCEARLAAKSTQQRTRAERFLSIGQRGALPVPLNFFGAHTGRWAASSGQAVNLQNLKRGSFLRKALMAPDGYVFVVSDLSQIEPRVLAWLAEYDDMLTIFKSGADPYATFGAQMFGVPGMTAESHPQLRQSAKSALLGAGYGLGFVSFAAQLLTGFLGAPPIMYDKEFLKQMGCGIEQVEALLDDAKNLPRVLEIPRTCSDKEIVLHAVAAREIINRYRSAAYPVTRLWRTLNNLIESSLAGGKAATLQGLAFSKGRILLPSGLALRYPDLRLEKAPDGGTQWVYGPRNKRLYGGALTENIVQAVARVVMTDGMRRVLKRYPVVLTVHDEIVALVPEREAEEAVVWCNDQMTITPSYMPNLPLKAGTSFAKRYGDAK